ncbi:MAG: SDR family oxidoreductase [Anaerolineales bacterium]|nr:SDR family oxidoreductase [Anaerolineales bacterium]
MDLQGRVSLVTGAAGGIGVKICEKFASLGSFVYLCDIKDTTEIVNSINSKYQKPRAATAKCDISNKEDVKAMYRHISEKSGGVDILINNAAVYGPKEKRHFPEISVDDFIKTIQIDLSGAVYCTLLAIPHMRQKGWGRIIFSAAPMSSSGIPSPYLAGKAGFIGLTKYISKNYTQDGILSFALALRHVDTPLIRKVIASRGHSVEDGIDAMNKKSLTGKMISPEEIAEIYAHFSLTSLPDLSGTVVLADGGITYLR